MDAAVRRIWVAAVTVACVAPSAAANVWPRLSHIRDNPGAATAAEVGVVVALIMSIAVMARVPFAIKKADSWLEKLGFLAIGLGLWTFNYLLAVDTAGQWRDAVTSPAALTASKAAALNSRITAAQTAADDLRKLPQASAAQIATAEQAVQIAQAAVTQECGKVGPNCRARQKELNDKIDDKAKHTSSKKIPKVYSDKK